MILAAGKGTRMRPLTYELPKPMIPILGKPVMEYLIEELSKHGFDKIMVNVSHLPMRIEQYFGDGRRWGVNIGYSFEGHIEEKQIISQPLGSAGGVKKIQQFSHFFDDTFLVICGDALIDLDLTAAVRQHWKSGAKASIVVKQVARDQVSNYGVVVCNEDGQITSFQEKPSMEEAKSNLANTGIYIFEPEIIDLIPENQEYDFGSQLFMDILNEQLPFYAINLPFSWIDIGRLNDYWEATQQMMMGRLKDVEIPGKQIKAGVWTGMNVSVNPDKVRMIGPVYIGASSKIEDGCEIIGPTWIGHGCYLQTGARVTRSILFEHTYVGTHGQLYEAVAYGQRCVDKDGKRIKDDDKELDWVTDARESHYYKDNVVHI